MKRIDRPQSNYIMDALKLAYLESLRWGEPVIFDGSAFAFDRTPIIEYIANAQQKIITTTWQGEVNDRGESPAVWARLATERIPLYTSSTLNMLERQMALLRDRHRSELAQLQSRINQVTQTLLSGGKS